jgi:hypothetical protein
MNPFSFPSSPGSGYGLANRDCATGKAVALSVDFEGKNAKGGIAYSQVRFASGKHTVRFPDGSRLFLP